MKKIYLISMYTRISDEIGYQKTIKVKFFSEEELVSYCDDKEIFSISMLNNDNS